jgi:4-hydroxy-tetrahydrodipicolinate synthase
MMREVPGIMGVKQSAGDLKLFADLMLACPPASASSRRSTRCSIRAWRSAPTAHLDAHLRRAAPVHRAVERGEARATTSAAWTCIAGCCGLWNAIYADNRIATFKYALSLQGLTVGTCRPADDPATPAQQAAIRAAMVALVPRQELVAAS